MEGANIRVDLLTLGVRRAEGPDWLDGDWIRTWTAAFILGVIVGGS